MTLMFSISATRRFIDMESRQIRVSLKGVSTTPHTVLFMRELPSDFFKTHCIVDSGIHCIHVSWIQRASRGYLKLIHGTSKGPLCVSKGMIQQKSLYRGCISLFPRGI